MVQLQFSKSNSSDTEALILDFIHVNFFFFFFFFFFVSYNIHAKRDDFDFHSVNFPFLDENVPVPRATSYKVYMFHFIRFTSV